MRGLFLLLLVWLIAPAQASCCEDTCCETVVSCCLPASSTAPTALAAPAPAPVPVPLVDSLRPLPPAPETPSTASAVPPVSFRRLGLFTPSRSGRAPPR